MITSRRRSNSSEEKEMHGGSSEHRKSKQSPTCVYPSITTASAAIASIANMRTLQTAMKKQRTANLSTLLDIATLVRVASSVTNTAISTRSRGTITKRSSTPLKACSRLAKTRPISWTSSHLMCLNYPFSSASTPRILHTDVRNEFSQIIKGHDSSLACSACYLNFLIEFRGVPLLMHLVILSQLTTP